MPPPSSIRVLLSGLVLCLLGMAGGCNLFADLESSPSSVEALLSDARIAMTTGDSERAVRFLEQAYARDSSHVGVRVELANALLATDSVDVFAVRAALDVLGTGGEPLDAQAQPGAVCSWNDAEAPRSSDLQKIAVEAEALGHMNEKRPVLRRVEALLVRGVLVRRPNVLTEKTVETQMKAYLLGALTRLGTGLARVRTTVRNTQTTLYLRVDTAPARFAACGSTRRNVRAVLVSLDGFAEGGHEALRWLWKRNDLASSQQVSVVIDRLDMLLQRIPE